MKTVATYTNDTKIQVPVLTINKNSFTKVKNVHLSHSIGGKPISEETIIQLKYNTDFLEIKFECKDNPRLNQNYYTEDNTALFNQEVFEIFITNGNLASEEYIEIQLNPNNALYLSKISYRYKTDENFKSEAIDTKTSGVEHSVEKDIENHTWSGSLRIPLSLLQYPKAISKTTYRLNMFRIISNKDQTDKKWRNSADNATFGCWSSTMAQKPQFHAPDYFGLFTVEIIQSCKRNKASYFRYNEK